MRYRAGILVIGLAVIAGVPAVAGEHEYCPPPGDHFLQRFAPVGGWHPAGGFLHWWDPHCFPRWCGPDDYCRKPFPNVCRPYCGLYLIPGGSPVKPPDSGR
jgi:hypothetical protein